MRALSILLTQFDGAADPERLFHLLCAFALHFGCTWTAYGPLTTEPKVFDADPHNMAPLSNYPDGWKEYCRTNGYNQLNPILNTIRKQTSVLPWSEAYNRTGTTDDERRMFDEAARFGLRSGITVPLRGPNGSFAIVSFAHPRDHTFEDTEIRCMQVAALSFHEKVTSVLEAARIDTAISLSQRQVQCLQWTARGKTSWETGLIVGISKFTVDFHLKACFKKLGVNNRTDAFMKALKLGFIQL
ncbi:helix-turn-helix transcriptional regulator [Rhizobium leguminosarum]|uniref:helix-turn-helix transcriptional regulator n=1 Tax=Rhizobium leguminosarum TaxID=384 RepID=UPI0007C8746D|nr:LuxR family transcriptional regulator [Rhizobium leguminosarum]WFT91056.1 LuxR family transcriptional regulator [Rhizobium leguminosarum]